ncbi:hypothetical protein SEA_NEWT_92 [Gordonia phage Newt]|uniref:Uncharacterized protein n=1 Tax=Gordonia phage Newt TaxID=2591191 RepID=A0A514A634_9CAUD|nr:hypothetical protein SEA_NEWT_92 [Gordonia phage Newt]
MFSIVAEREVVVEAFTACWTERQTSRVIDAMQALTVIGWVPRRTREDWDDDELAEVNRCVVLELERDECDYSCSYMELWFDAQGVVRTSRDDSGWAHEYVNNRQAF